MNYLQNVHVKYNYSYKRIANGINNLLIKNKSILRVSDKKVNRYATGENIPREQDIITAIAQYVNVSINELMQGFKESKQIRKRTL